MVALGGGGLSICLPIVPSTFGFQHEDSRWQHGRPQEGVPTIPRIPVGGDPARCMSVTPRGGAQILREKLGVRVRAAGIVAEITPAGDARFEPRAGRAEWAIGIRIAGDGTRLPIHAHSISARDVGIAYASGTAIAIVDAKARLE